MASSYAIRSTPSETFNKLTVSCWFKGMADGTQRNFWGLYDNSDNNRFFGLYFSTNGSLYAYWKQDGGTVVTLGTEQKFKDPSFWYHFVMTMDTTLATASDRVKFYVNGERVTSFEDDLDTITQSKNCDLMNGTTDGRMQWGGGKMNSGTQYYWNGSLSHCHMCVGYAYDASSFGSTDATTGSWRIITSPSVSYGTNGGFWFKDGSQLTDSSTNSNTLTSSGTITPTEDCPSNVFATLNPLLRQVAAQLASSPTNGNTTLTSGSGTAWGTLLSTIGASSGKYYCEAKLIAAGSYARLGICDMSVSQQNSADSWFVGQTSSSAQYGINSTNGNLYTNAGDSSYANSFTDGDIIGIAMDLDNSKLYFSKNGTWQNSGVPTSGSTGTGAQSITADKTYGFAISGYASTVWNVNFGNGYFGTTAISSEGTNASGIGKFEYDVPANYTALSTKGLNE